MKPNYVPNFEHCLLPYVQWYQDDFVGGVRGMKSHEIGIYMMLLMEMYTRGKALDQPHDRLARMCGSDKRSFERVLEQLVDDGKIIKLNCGYWNERCENAFRTRAKMREQKSDAAHQSWENRRKNNGDEEQMHSGRNASAMLSSEAQIIEAQTPVPGDFTSVQSPARNDCKDLSSTPAEPPSEEVPQWHGSDEERFWSMVPEWEKATGVKRGQLLQIQKFNSCGFDDLIAIAKSAANAKDARSYLGKIASDARRDSMPPPPPDPKLPEWVSRARAEGYPVDKEGKYWRFAGGLFDNDKQQVGN